MAAGDMSGGCNAERRRRSTSNFCACATAHCAIRTADMDQMAVCRSARSVEKESRAWWASSPDDQIVMVDSGDSVPPHGCAIAFSLDVVDK